MSWRVVRAVGRVRVRVHAVVARVDRNDVVRVENRRGARQHVVRGGLLRLKGRGREGGVVARASACVEVGWRVAGQDVRFMCLGLLKALRAAFCGTLR